MGNFNFRHQRSLGLCGTVMLYMAWFMNINYVPWRLDTC